MLDLRFSQRLMGYNAMQVGVRTQTFRKNKSPTSSVSNRNSSCPLYAGFLVGLLFDPQDGGIMFLRKDELTFTGIHAVIFQKTQLHSIRIAEKYAEIWRVSRIRNSTHGYTVPSIQPVTESEYLSTLSRLHFRGNMIRLLKNTNRFYGIQ
jgi:hypothetical protein